MTSKGVSIANAATKRPERIERRRRETLRSRHSGDGWRETDRSVKRSRDTHGTRGVRSYCNTGHPLSNRSRRATGRAARNMFPRHRFTDNAGVVNVGLIPGRKRQTHSRLVLPIVTIPACVRARYHSGIVSREASRRVAEPAVVRVPMISNKIFPADRDTVSGLSGAPASAASGGSL